MSAHIAGTTHTATTTQATSPMIASAPNELSARLSATSNDA